MSDIVADAKAWLETRPARRFVDGRTHHPTCHETHVDCLVERLVAEVERLRMTEAEREAIQEVIDYLQPAGQRHQNHVAATLRGLLERTK